MAYSLRLAQRPPLRHAWCLQVSSAMAQVFPIPGKRPFGSSCLSRRAEPATSMPGTSALKLGRSWAHLF